MWAYSVCITIISVLMILCIFLTICHILARCESQQEYNSELLHNVLMYYSDGSDGSDGNA